MRGIKKRAKILQRSVVWINVEIIRDVIAVILERRRIERQEPERVDTEFLEIIELFDQPAKVSNPICISVVKRLDVQLVNDRVFKPKWIGRRHK